MRSRLHRSIALLSIAAAVLVVSASPAAACGGLVGENGTIRLGKTTTLAAWHDGIERYVTSFEFSGEGEELGSIIPLPGVPTDVTRGGDWTLQRLEREVAPVELFAADAAAPAAGTAGKAEVLLETKIDALDITILKGGGAEVGQWAVEHGFLLTPDAPEVLDFYSQRSPIFMAARFDANAARELGQQSGDGTPIMLTIPVEQPWVPLRILGLGLGDDERINADVFLLTDRRPQLLAGESGLQLVRSEPASTGLLDDLRSDVGMGWVPPSMWFSYLTVDATAGDLHYDLASSVRPLHAPSLRDTGLASPLDGVDLDFSGSLGGRSVPFEALVLATVALGAVVVLGGRRLRTATR
jgi:hypothetical protein